jgi:hypothetical protein
MSTDTGKTIFIKDAKATYAMRLQIGDEAFRKALSQRFFGS